MFPIVCDESCRAATIRFFATIERNMSNSLCTLCFQNYGLRQEAQQLAGATIEGQCPNCLQAGGQLLDTDAVEELMRKFFVNGSVPPNVGGPAPLYQFNQYRYPGEVTFATELDSDLRRLSDFLKVGLFHYGPPLWRLGLTEHYQALRGYMDGGTEIQDDQRKKLWQGILNRCSVRTIDPDANIFRVRKGETLPPALPGEFDAPPLGVPTGGRYESKELPVFYGADDIETCLHESRVTLSIWKAIPIHATSARLPVISRKWAQKFRGRSSARTSRTSSSGSRCWTKVIPRRRTGRTRCARYWLPIGFERAQVPAYG